MLRSIPIKEPLKAPVIQPLTQPFQPDPSLVLWLLPQRDNKWYDYSGKGNHGTIHNAVWKPMPAGVGLYVNGTTAYTDHGAGTSLAIPDALTIKVWAKPATVLPSFASLLRRQLDINSYFLSFDDANHMRFRTEVEDVGRVTSISPLTYNDNQWHRFVGTWDGTKQRLYVDGNEVDSDDQSGVIQYDASVLTIGAANTTPDFLFKGTFGEIMLLERGWSAAEEARSFRAERVWYGV